MKKLLTTFSLLLITFCLFSQDEKKAFIHKGLLRSTGSIAAGTPLKYNSTTIYLYGNLEGYVSDNVSIRGDSYFDMSAASNKPSMKMFQFNHTTFSGISYHFKTKNHFDPYLAFEPGIAISKRDDMTDMMWDFGVPDYYHKPPKTEVNPVSSLATGFNYYFQRWFHLFAEARYINGRHLTSDGSPTLSLSELRFSFGLGWNISLLKKK